MSDFPPFCSLDTNNLDHLVVIARGFEEANAPKRRKEIEERDLFLTKLERSGAKVLDSLAYVLVSDKDKQVVAVGALGEGKREGDKMRLVVSENGQIEDKTQAHLVEILARLRKLSLAYPDKKGSPVNTFADDNQPTEFERQLVALEGLILHYAWRKNAQRFWKRSQHLDFIKVAADVLGEPASERVGERTAKEIGLLQDLQAGLLTLRQSINETRGECDLADVLIATEALDTVFRQNLDGNLRDFEGGIRNLLYMLRGGKKLLEGNTKLAFRVNWDNYTSERIRRGWADDKTTVSDNARLGKAPDVLRWLSKSTALCDHFLRIASVATSTKLAYVFLSEQTPPLFLDNPHPTPATILIGREDVRQALVAARVRSSDDGEIDEFLRKLEAVHGNKTIKVGNQLAFPASGSVHCECNLLARLLRERAVLYVGVSKLSCAFCDAYFTAVRVPTKNEFYTMGSHDRTTNWSCPTLTDPELDALVRNELRESLLQKVKEGWTRYRKKIRRASQSTDVSDSSDYVKGKVALTPAGVKELLQRLKDKAKLEAPHDEREAPNDEHEASNNEPPFITVSHHKNPRYARGDGGGSSRGSGVRRGRGRASRSGSPRGGRGRGS